MIRSSQPCSGRGKLTDLDWRQTLTTTEYYESDIDVYTGRPDLVEIMK
jgi:hypothetical protein